MKKVHKKLKRSRLKLKICKNNIKIIFQQISNQKAELLFKLKTFDQFDLVNFQEQNNYEYKIKNNLINEIKIKDYRYKIYEVNPNVSTKYFTTDQISEYLMQMENFWCILAQNCQNIKLYKYDDLAKISLLNENDLKIKIIKEYVTWQNKRIKQSNKHLLNKFYLLINLEEHFDEERFLYLLKNIDYLKIKECNEDQIKKIENVINLKQKYAQHEIIDTEDYLKIDDEYLMFLQLEDFDSIQFPEYLTSLFKYPGIDILLDVKQISNETYKSAIDKSINEINSRINKQTKNSQKNIDLIKLTSLKEASKKLSSDFQKTKVHKVNIIFLFRAKELDSLYEKCELFNKEVSKFFKVKATYDMVGKMRRFWSLQDNKTNEKTNISFNVGFRNKELLTYMLAYGGIFNNINIIEKDGMLINHDLYGKIQLNTNHITDYRKSFTSLIIGNSGGGKSFFIKLKILHELYLGNKVFNIDIQGDFKKLCQEVKGVNVDVSQGLVINPLELVWSVEGEEFQEGAVYQNREKVISKQINYVKQFINIANDRQMSHHELALVDNLLKDSYREYLKVNDLNVHTPKDQSLTFSEVYQTGIKQKNKYEMVLPYIEVFYSGSLAIYFNSPTTIGDFEEKDFINFDISKFKNDKYILDLLLYNITEYFVSFMDGNRKFNQKNRKKFAYQRRYLVLVIDEAHRIFANTNAEVFVDTLSREARKFVTSVYFVTQGIKEIQDAGAGSVLNQITYKFCFKQAYGTGENSATERLARALGVESSKIDNIQKSEAGRGIIAIENELYDLDVSMDKYDKFEYFEDIFDGGQGR